jgi:hypothetical protein
MGQRGKPQPRHYISGSQGLFHNTFPIGKRITTFSLVDRRLAASDPKTRQTRSLRLAQSPVAIGGGGDYLDARIYFFRGSHLHSYSLKAAR